MWVGGETVVKSTEERNPSSMRLSDMTAVEIVALMTFEERRVLDALSAVSAKLAAAAEKVAATYRSGGRLFFLGAGTSGRLAVMEAAELPPTFGVPIERFVAFVAAGPTAGSAAVTSCEDDTRAAPDALGAAGCSNADAVIGLAASGTTNFVVSGLNAARSVGAWTCGLANNPDTPVLAAADLPILLDTGPEILTGSTRLKAGTAQKLALNRITTAALVRAGLVRSNLMINVSASNTKLRNRCVNIVSELAGVSEPDAAETLEAVGWAVPAALAVLERSNRRDPLDYLSLGRYHASVDDREARPMAKGRRCPECGSPMYAQTEKHEPKGTTVTYVCRSGTCPSAKRGYPATEKVFEGG